MNRERLLMSGVERLKKQMKNKEEKMENLRGYLGRLREVAPSPLTIMVYYLAIGCGVMGAWMGLWIFASKTTSMLAINIFAAMCFTKTCAAYLAHHRSEKGWMVTVSFLPMIDIYYMCTRTWKQDAVAVEATEVTEAA